MLRVPRVAVGLPLFVGIVGLLWISVPSPGLTAATGEALQYLVTLGTPGEPGVAAGRFVAPQAAVYDPAGRLYVSDTEWYPDLLGDRVQVFDAGRQHLESGHRPDTTKPFNAPAEPNGATSTAPPDPVSISPPTSRGSRHVHGSISPE